MRTNGELALGWMLMLCSGACGASHSPCGSGGSHVADSAADGEYCVYPLSLPIVIEGGFACPPAMQFQMDVGEHRVCSDRALARGRLPTAVCARVGSACSQDGSAMPGTPQANERGPDSRPGPQAGPMAGTSTDSDPVRDPSEPRSWTGDCHTNGVLETGLTGDLCPDGNFGCGTSDRCGANFAMCDPSGILQTSNLVIHDCDPDMPRAPESAPRVWSGVDDCDDALRDGASFQACEGPFVCAQRTADPCCVEYALCAPSGGTTEPHLLYRYSFCERGCGLVEPHATLEPVTGCEHFANEADFWPIDLKRADLPCVGDFICWNGEDVSAGASAEVPQQVGVLRWCSGGIVRGQHSTISNLFVPMP